MYDAADEEPARYDYPHERDEDFSDAGGFLGRASLLEGKGSALDKKGCDSEEEEGERDVVEEYHHVRDISDFGYRYVDCRRAAAHQIQ